MSRADICSVAVCDTEPVAIEGIRALLDSLQGFRMAAAESSLPEGMDAVRRLQPDLLLVDKAFGIHAVMDWLKNIRQNGAATVAVVWGTALSEAEALRFLQAGAAGVIRKTAPISSLLQCLRTVVSGSTWMESTLFQEKDRTTRNGRTALTARELQVMELVERGMKNKDIALALGIRTGTVKIHLKHIFEKTGIRGRYGLALTGLREKGLLAVSAIETMKQPEWYPEH
jgi:DNA-binding NarL/FixJ family response regulator